MRKLSEQNAPAFVQEQRKILYKKVKIKYWGKLSFTLQEGICFISFSVDIIN